MYMLVVCYYNWPHSGTPGTHPAGESGGKGQAHTQDKGGGSHQQDRSSPGRPQHLHIKKN